MQLVLIKHELLAKSDSEEQRNFELFKDKKVAILKNIHFFTFLLLKNS